MATEYSHIFLLKEPETGEFTSPRQPVVKRNIPERDRQSHSAKLQEQWEAIWLAAKEQEDSRTAVSMPAKGGVYVVFEGKPGFDLMTRSLEARRFGIRLLNIVTVPSEDTSKEGIVRATVFIPTGKQGNFLKKIREYAEQNTNGDKPRHSDLIRSVEDIRLAVLESFWCDDPSLLPGRTAVWCEIWLQETNEEIESRFREIAATLGIELRARLLHFPERIVLLGKATRAQLVDLIESSPDIAEFRCAKEAAQFFLELENKDQTEWVLDLSSRLVVNPEAKVAVCVLDTGVNNGHLLLQSVLTDTDRHAVEPEWGVDDHEGHGTAMCGVVAFGDLAQALQHKLPVQINHRLESVKILPPRGENDPDLYGDITRQGMSRAAIQAADRVHIGCMPVTSKDGRDRGRPSSWSAAIDQLTSGYDDNDKSLFIVSAGNVEENDWIHYPRSNLTHSIHDPGQSWNALSVGAYTERTILSDPDLQDYSSLAQSGELSPFSSTSVEWDVKWPNKPDIVLEGGNLARAPDGFIGNHDELSLLSLGHQPTQRQFAPINATSAAAAQAAWMAAQIQTRYPEAWPETIRGLMIHSAEWPMGLKKQFGPEGGQGRYLKGDYRRLLRVCGYGVPNLTKALACASNSLTLISESELQPYTKKNSSYPTNDMHLHKLPWLGEELLDLGETLVTLRITLSYFIEPGPGEVGWRDRYRYASFGLRFALNRPGETDVEFWKRLSKAARSEGEERVDTDSGSERWLIGPNSRDRGSSHSDIWTGTAADIATCNLIGIYPVIGWWRDRPWLNRWDRKARYSLIVSLHTQDEDIDIYTPVAVQLGIPVEVAA